MGITSSSGVVFSSLERDEREILAPSAWTFVDHYNELGNNAESVAALQMTSSVRDHRH